MQDGKVSMAYKHFLGYTKGADGKPQIVGQEAEIIQKIYNMFLNGQTYREISSDLTKQKIPTPGGKEIWRVSTIKSILKNEKYAGNAILQKKFTVDFLTKKTKVNEGELPQYFVENSHPAIISPETFEVVQGEISRQEALGKHLSASGLFRCKTICGDCDGFYGSKTWNSNNTSRRVIWQCNKKYINDKACQTPNLTDENIQAVFVSAFNQLLANKNQFIFEYENKITELSDMTPFDKQAAKLEIECAEASALAQEIVRQNATTTQDQKEYKAKYDALLNRYDTAKSQLEAIKQEKQKCRASKGKIQRFLDLLKSIENPLTAFNEELWQDTVESVIIYSLENISVTFKSGTKIQTRLESKKQ